MAKIGPVEVTVKLEDLGFSMADTERLRNVLIWGQRVEQIHSPEWTSHTYTPDGGTQHQPDELYRWLTRPDDEA